MRFGRPGRCRSGARAACSRSTPPTPSQKPSTAVCALNRSAPTGSSAWLTPESNARRGAKSTTRYDLMAPSAGKLRWSKRRRSSVPFRRRAKEPAQFSQWSVQGRGADHSGTDSHSKRGIWKGTSQGQACFHTLLVPFKPMNGLRQVAQPVRASVRRLPPRSSESCTAEMSNRDSSHRQGEP